MIAPDNDERRPGEGGAAFDQLAGEIKHNSTAGRRFVRGVPS